MFGRGRGGDPGDIPRHRERNPRRGPCDILFNRLVVGVSRVLLLPILGVVVSAIGHVFFEDTSIQGMKHAPQCFARGLLLGSYQNHSVGVRGKEVESAVLHTGGIS